MATVIRRTELKQAQDASETRELSDKSERVELNRLLGLPLRQFYPAFRITLEQVRAATTELRNGNRYGAEKIIYPHQSSNAVADGFSMVLNAREEA